MPPAYTMPLAYASASTLSFVDAIAKVEVRTRWVVAAEAGAVKISPAADSKVAASTPIRRQHFMITPLISTQRASGLRPYLPDTALAIMPYRHHERPVID